MWEEIKLKLEKLKNLDSDFVLFGADKHKYHSNPVASENQIQQIETILKVSLPIELREFYKNVGNGIVGPHYGIKKVSDLPDYCSPYKPYLGSSYIEDDDDDDDYYEPGFIPIIEMGCGDEISLIANGEKVGQVIKIVERRVAEECSLKLTDYYDQWLTKNIAIFERAQELIRTTATFKEISNEINNNFNFWRAEKVVMSLITQREKQKSTVEEMSSVSVYGGHITTINFPIENNDLLYEKQLYDYRKKNNITVDPNIHILFDNKRKNSFNKRKNSFLGWLFSKW